MNKIVHFGISFPHSNTLNPHARQKNGIAGVKSRIARLLESRYTIQKR
jgi:hypothetical protein